MVQCRMLPRSTGCYRKTGAAGGFYPPLRFRLMGRSVGADRIRPNVTGLNCSLNGTMLDVAPFNRDISLSGGRAIHQGIPKGKALLCPLGCLPCHNHGAASCGVFPSLGKPDWGNSYAAKASILTTPPQWWRMQRYESIAQRWVAMEAEKLTVTFRLSIFVPKFVV